LADVDLTGSSGSEKASERRIVNDYECKEGSNAKSYTNSYCISINQFVTVKEGLFDPSSNVAACAAAVHGAEADELTDSDTLLRWAYSEA
jgi:hypothetical protein